MMQAEYGSASPRGSDADSRSNKQRVMLGLCAASMLLVVTALALNQSPSASVQLADKMVQIQALAGANSVTHAKQKAAAIAAKSDEASPNWPGAKGARHAVSVLDKKPAAKAAAAAPKAAAAAAPKEAKAAPKAVKAAVSPPKSEAAGAKQAKAAAPAALKRAMAASKEASAKQAAVMHSVMPRIAAGVSLANSTAPAAGGNATAAAGAKEAKGGGAEGSKEAGAGEADTKDEGKEGVEGDQFNSPLGSLNPTGIMSVFFNEKIMLTALGVIGSLLILICCFARNADCALS